jgi:hypothetical protein
MARARLLKPGFFKNERLARTSAHARLCFAGLWTLADREGRLEDRPERIKVEIFPYEDAVTVDMVDSMLRILAHGSFIVRYGVRGGGNGWRRFIAIPAFLDHQTPHHREPPSRFPAPPSHTKKSQAKSRASGRAEPEAMPTSGPTVRDPVRDPVGRSGTSTKSSAAAAARLPAGNGEDDPEKNVGVITRIAREVLDNGVDPNDRAEAVKTLCAKHHIAYNSSVVRKALDSAEFQRSHR